uniref:Uncharacterized protein n=1 Tax=Oryza brachyantha TaxID=4533 RepID=J3MHI7_ORYBR
MTAAGAGAPGTDSYTSPRIAAACGGEVRTRKARVAARTRCGKDAAAAAAMGAEAARTASSLLPEAVRVRMRCICGW